MNYLIISDSHGLEDDMFQLFEKYPDYQIIHCGDYCISYKELDKYNALYAKGNCDFYGKDEIILDSDYGIMFISHGHRYNVKYQYESIYYRGKELNASYVIFGHTHVPLCEKINEIWFLNPGSLKNGTYIIIENGQPRLVSR